MPLHQESLRRCEPAEPHQACGFWAAVCDEPTTADCMERAEGRVWVVGSAVDDRQPSLGDLQTPGSIRDKTRWDACNGGGAGRRVRAACRPMLVAASAASSLAARRHSTGAVA